MFYGKIFKYGKHSPTFNPNSLKQNCKQALQNQDFVLAYRICEGLKKFPHTRKYSEKILSKLTSDPKIVQLLNQQNLIREPDNKIKSNLLKLLDTANDKLTTIIAYQSLIVSLDRYFCFK